MQANRTSWGTTGTSSTHIITTRTRCVGVLGYVRLRACAQCAKTGQIHLDFAYAGSRSVAFEFNGREGQMAQQILVSVSLEPKHEHIAGVSFQGTLNGNVAIKDMRNAQLTT